MYQPQNIKAILFDSGRTLNYPKTGNWFIPPNLYKFIDINKIKSINKFKRSMAFNSAYRCLASRKLILTEEEEYEAFLDFYSIISRKLKKLNLSCDTVKSIARDTVYNNDKFVFYNDVFTCIPKLSEKYALAVVSDTWPSLDRVFREAHLREYFSSFVMSSLLGVTKPNKLMYLTALKELNVEPYEALFIDDSIKNIKGAEKLGIKTLLIVRDEDASIPKGQPYIKTLKELDI